MGASSVRWQCPFRELSLHPVPGCIRCQSQDIYKPADRSAGKGERRQFQARDARQQRIVLLRRRRGACRGFQRCVPTGLVPTRIRVPRAGSCNRFHAGQASPGRRGLDCAASELLPRVGQNQNGAAFARGDLLVGIKAQDGEIAKPAHAPAVKLGPDGLAGIFDEHEPMSIGDGPKRLHIGGNSKRMDHEDGAGAGRNRALHSPPGRGSA